MKKIFAAVLATAMMFTMAGCKSLYQLDPASKTEQELVHTLHSGDDVGLRYFDELDYTDIEFEEIYWQTNDRLAVGPTEPWYAGVLYLTEDQADKLWDEYEWEECEFPDIELYDIEVPQTDSNVWCSSADFNAYIQGQAVNVENIVFNGSVIVFYLKVF